MKLRTPSLTYEPARPAPITQPSRSARRGRLIGTAALLGLGVFLALLLVSPGTINVLDGQSMYQVTRSIVEQGNPTVSAPIYGVPGTDGQLYSKYGPGQSLAAAPLYLLGRALEPLVPDYFRPELPALAASLLPALATTLTAALLLLCALELGATPLGALALALVYAVATPAAVYATQWFSEPLTGCALLAAVYTLLWERARPGAWGPLLAGLALALAVATRLDALLFAPPLLLYALLAARDRRDGWGRAVSLLLPVGATLALLGLYNAARFGSPLETGYGRDPDPYAYRDAHAFHGLSALAEGVYGLLISPGKGLLEYAPPVLLAPFGAAVLWARRRAEALLLLSLIAIDLLAHANVLIRWVGGWSWGPRFLLPVLPLCLLLLAPLLGPGVRFGRPARAALIVLALAGLLIQAPALALYEPQAYIRTLQPRYHAAGPHPTVAAQIAANERMEWAYINQPALSPIIASWRLLGMRGAWAHPRDVAPASVAAKSVVVAPHTWWRLLALQGAPAFALALACVALGALALGCLLVARWLAGSVMRR